MEAFVLGCGGMQPLPYRHLTSVLLKRDGDLFLFDGGEGTQVSLKRLNLKWKKRGEKRAKSYKENRKDLCKIS